MKLHKYQSAVVRWGKDGGGSRAGFWEMLLFYAAMYVITDLTKPKPDTEGAKPNGLGSIKFPTATEGRVIPIGWGVFRCEGLNVIWYGDFKADAIFEQVRINMFKKEGVIRAWEYRVGIQEALCLGSDDTMNLRGVWIADKRVANYISAPKTHAQTFGIDKPNLFGGYPMGNGGFSGTFQFFAGTSTQAPSQYFAGGNVNSITIDLNSPGSGYTLGDILTEAGDGTASVRATFEVQLAGVMTVINPGVYTVQSSNPVTLTGGTGSGRKGNLKWGAAVQNFNGSTPSYKGVCYVAPFTQHAYVGNSLNIAAKKYEVQRVPNGLALTGGKDLVDECANPANVLYEIRTDDDWGYGDPAADIDVANFTTAAETLYAERNGFGFFLDQPMELPELIRMIEQQINGILFKDPLTQKWKISLIRDDYDIDLIPLLDETSIRDIRNFTAGTWEGTVNHVHVPFTDKDDSWKETYGFDQDMANVLRVGKNVSSTIKHPGVKTKYLANSLASRELQSLAIPLINATLVVDRTAYGLIPGSPFAFADADAGYTKLPMRVLDIDYGDVLNDRIIINAIQDVFTAPVGTMDEPTGTAWEEPGDDLVAYPTDEQIVFEAPRALTFRDQDSEDPETDKICVSARAQANESYISIRERHAAGVPAGAYTEIGKSYGFALIGELNTTMNLSSTNPLTSVVIVPDPDTQAAIDAIFPDLTNVTDLGDTIETLCMVDDEFFLVLSSQTSGDNVQLNSVYRGVLDSVQADHAAGAKVYALFNGISISDSVLPAGDNVDVLAIPVNAFAELDEGDATAVSLTMDNRTRRPYPPATFDINSVEMDLVNVDLDGSGSGEDVGVLIDSVIRRDFRTANEIAPLSTDAGTLVSDFPSAHTTTIEVEVRNGVTVLDSETGISGTSATMRQLDILQGLDTTSLPASLTFAVRQSHTLDSVVYKSRVWLEVTSTIASEFVGKHAFGALDESDVSTVYEVQSGQDGTDHVFNLSTAFTVGDVEYRVEGGSWTTLIAAGGTGPGTIAHAGLSVGHDIEVRHLSTDTSPQKLLTMTVGGTEEAYAVLIS